MDYQVTMPFKGISADDRRSDRRTRLVEAAFEIAGTEGAGALGVGRVCLEAGLTKRYFYENFASLAELQSAVVDHAIAVMSQRVDPFRPAGPGGPPQAWLEAFVGALVDDECLARVLLAETHGGALSAFRHQIIDVAIAGMAPPDSDPQADLRARLVAYAQIGTLSELCLAWHQGHLVMKRAALVDVLADLFVRINGAPGPDGAPSGRQRGRATARDLSEHSLSHKVDVFGGAVPGRRGVRKG
jgi:AcrR family transcriptional regulator